MPGTVARLRAAIIVAGTLLVAVLLGFFFFSQWKQRFLKGDLPRRLGINIQQDSTGFTLSKSEHGKTLFTLHAARAVQLKGQGNAELHDVRIVLYGQGAVPRQDRISGDSFAYDPRTQTVTANGSVMIDIQSPETPAHPHAGEHDIHLKTSGLVFNQKTGEATTSQSVEFVLPQANGTAVGADYDSEKGLVTLRSDVHLHSTLDDGPANITSNSAVLDRPNWTIQLADAKLDSARHKVTAQQLTVWLRPDGTTDHLLAQGSVTLTALDGTVLTAPKATAQFDDDSRAQKAYANGGVVIRQPAVGNKGADREAHAQQAWLDLDQKSKPVVLRMAGRVVLQEADRQSAKLLRTLHAEDVRVLFQDGVARDLKAQGSPQFAQVQQVGAGQASKRLSADVLTATLQSGKVVQAMDGEGNTRLEQQSTASGETDVSQGDHISATFAPEQSGPAQILEATQQGNVRIDRQLPVVKGSAAIEHTLAHADRAVYQEDGETVVLTGAPRVSDTAPGRAALNMAAQQITLYRDSGNAVAAGSVQGSVVNQPGSAPEHVVADRAVVDHAAQTITFTGKPRLWQQGNSVEGYALVLTQLPRGLTATAGPNGSPLVKAVLTSEGRKGAEEPVRVTARKLVYSDADRRARFSNNVTLIDSNGTVRADQTDVFFAKAAPDKTPAAATQDSMLAGKLERIVAEGNIFLTQPLRQGTGQELVYTASDGKFLLTGSDKRPPRIEDRQQGTVSGEALQFLSRDDRVDILGNGQRTVTTTHLQK
jgi:lipopolysaccharide export system protein LptA